MALYQKSQIRKIRNEHDFRFTKSLGQNFLVDGDVVESIIDGSLIGPDDLVIEIGPGMGTLTVPASERAGKLIAVELDKELIPILKETLAGRDNVEIINEDIMKVDLADLISEKTSVKNSGGENTGKGYTSAENTGEGSSDSNTSSEYKAIRIIGNLPYYITTSIIMKVLKEDIPAKSLTFMMQKEVADRITARPGTKDYGALSVSVQYHCTAEKICDAPAECFEPRPKVDSQVLLLTLRDEKAVKVKDESVFNACVKAGFAQRRKTLTNCLTAVMGNDKELIKKVLTEAGIDPARRAETLTIEEFGKVADKVADSKV